MANVKHRDLDREARLKAINAMIATHPDLARQGYKITRLGMNAEGEPEIIELTRVFDAPDDDPFHVYLHFKVRLPGGGEAARPVRVNRNGNGAGMIVLINGRFVVVKQPRLPIGLLYTYEFPRGYSEALDSRKIDGALGEMTLADLRLGVVQRELGEEAVQRCVIRSITHLGNMPLNTGPDATIMPMYVVMTEFRGDDRDLRGEEEGHEVHLWSAERVEAEIGGKLVDAITLGMHARFRRWQRSLPQPPA